MKNITKYLVRYICTTLSKIKLGKKCGANLRVNFLCKFTSNTEIGNCCNFNGIKISGTGKVHIGSYFHSGKYIRILTSNHNYKGEMIPYDETMVTKDVWIDDFVWLGESVMILPGVHIGEGAIIQAGSVVVKNIPSYAIAGGHPAKVFAWRNKEKFQKLKSENKVF